MPSRAFSRHHRCSERTIVDRTSSSLRYSGTGAFLLLVPPPNRREHHCLDAIGSRHEQLGVRISAEGDSVTLEGVAFLQCTGPWRLSALSLASCLTHFDVLNFNAERDSGPYAPPAWWGLSSPPYRLRNTAAPISIRTTFGSHSSPRRPAACRDVAAPTCRTR